MVVSLVVQCAMDEKEEGREEREGNEKNEIE